MVENSMPPKKGITLLLGVNGWIAHQERFTWESSCLFFSIKRILMANTPIVF